MATDGSNESPISVLLVKYIIEEDCTKRKEYALQLRDLSKYEAFPELYRVNSELSVDDVPMETIKENVDSKQYRFVPCMKQNDYPIYILNEEETDIDESSNFDALLQLRKSMIENQIIEFSPQYLYSVEDGTDPCRWCISVFKDILCDCQYLLKRVIGHNCQCPVMTSQTGFEYRCSCHPRNMKCSAIDYYYHNLNYSTLKLSQLENYTVL